MSLSFFFVCIIIIAKTEDPVWHYPDRLQSRVINFIVTPAFLCPWRNLPPNEELYYTVPIYYRERLQDKVLNSKGCYKVIYGLILVEVLTGAG